MFSYTGVSDVLSKMFVGKYLAELGGEIICEKITSAHCEDGVSFETEGGEYPHIDDDANFVVIPALLEIDFNAHSTLVDKDGDIFTAQEFYDTVQAGGFIDSDGYGFPSDGTKMAIIPVNVAKLASAKYSKSVTHVVWFNR